MAVTVHDPSARDPEDRPWLRRIILTLIVMVLAGGGLWAAYEMGLYGTHRGQRKRAASTAQVEISFAHTPAWLPQENVPSTAGGVVANSWIDSSSNRDSLIADVIDFTQMSVNIGNAGDGPISNYRRLQDPQNLGVLRDLAGYLQEDSSKHPIGEHGRAWIKSIRSIKRESVRDKNTGQDTERIIIDAEYREPLAFVVQGNAYYLVEKVTTVGGGRKDGVEQPPEKRAIRLPGIYTAATRKALMELPCVGGIDSPTPEPGHAFTTPDVIAGLELAAVLAKEPYAKQIATINMSNYQGRREKDPNPFIVLETIFANPDNHAEPTQIRWGRALGDEQFFEVRSPAKLQYLTALFMRYNRIDAGEAYVDIRFDQPIIPMAARQPRSAADPEVTPSMAMDAH